MTTAPYEIIEFPFLAPVPRGHEVFFAILTQSAERASLVLDRTARLIYTLEALFTTVGTQPAIFSDPIPTLEAQGWTVERAQAGVSHGAIVLSHDRRNRARTRLFVGPAPSAYR
ncbi:MAG: hypothetical protein KF901_27615 [Myxococcales bacterium]|nr:hypothetical protein [Myxococcales bacterium]